MGSFTRTRTIALGVHKNNYRTATASSKLEVGQFLQAIRYNISDIGVYAPLD